MDPAVDRPSEILWSNGEPSTLADYARHQVATSVSAYAADGTLVMTMHPDVVAEVRFKREIGRWICEAPDGRIILDLDDEGVADEQIVAELATYPIVYRAAIIRAKMK
jgi:hypothetical protein